MFYVYAHYKIGEENIPFYIGKGSKRRAYERRRRSIWWNNVANKYGFYVKILCDNLIESDAFLLEKQLIGMFGRADLGKGPLVNMTDGGDGSSGYVSLPEKNKVHSEFMKGNKNREGKACSEESKIKSSNTNKARYAAGAIHGRKDKSHTAETKKLISDILKEKYENGYVHPQTGIPRTQATKERIKKTKLNKMAVSH